MYVPQTNLVRSLLNFFGIRHEHVYSPTKAAKAITCINNNTYTEVDLNKQKTEIYKINTESIKDTISIRRINLFLNLLQTLLKPRQQHIPTP